MLGNRVTFKAAGGEHEIRVGNRALRELEQHFGCNAVELGQRLEASASISDVTEVLRIALGGVYTVEQVDELIDELGYARIGALLTEAFAAAMPPATEGN